MADLAVGQVAIIRDEDGFTNVRSEPDGQSEVIHKIYNNEVFWYDNEEVDKHQDWVSVYIPKSKYSMGCSGLDALIGYIHRSRLQPLQQLPAYQKDDFQFNYILTDFDSTDKIIDRHDGRSITAIDGRPVWGTDGNLPKIQISDINITIEGHPLTISPAFYNDLYECNRGFSIRKIDDTYFVFQENSDGAGYYEVVWVLTREGLKQRLVGSII